MTQDIEKKNTKGLGKEKPNPLNIRGRKWFITKHDYTITHIDCIKEIKAEKWAYCKEECPTTKRKHLHIFLKLKNAVTIRKLKKIFGDSKIEKCKGNDDQNLLYIMKDGNYESSFKKEEPEWEVDIIKELREWQEDLMEKLKNRPNDRTVMWYYDTLGGKGKTAITKVLLKTRKCILVGGRNQDVINGIDNYYEENKKYPQIVIINLPRSKSEVSYSAIESVKDGLCVNTKYKCRFHMFASPHIIVFANREPIKEMLSEDRWDIVCLD